MKRLDEILGKLEQVKAAKDGYMACCPAHMDTNPSLSVRKFRGRIHLKCFAGCAEEDVCMALNITLNDLFQNEVKNRRQKMKKKIVATYDYFNSTGKLIFQVVRYEPKGFAQRRRVDGKWIWDMKGVKQILYRLPSILSASGHEWIFIVEGEKDVETLTKYSIIATTNSGGAGKWHLTDSEPLHGKKIAIIPDNDSVGIKHAHQIALSLHEKASELKIVNLDGLEDKEDVTDWFEKGGMRIKLMSIVEETKQFSPDMIPEEEVSENIKSGVINLDPNDPLKTARKFLSIYYTTEDTTTLRSYAGMVYFWKSGFYREIEKGALRQRLYHFLEKTVVYDDEKEKPVPFKPNKQKVDRIIDALLAEIHLSNDLTPPFWLVPKEGSPSPIHLITTKSKILNLENDEIHDATPRLFSTNALPFDYDPNAPKPERWMQFLKELWEDDQESIETLQKWFGYCLTSDTSLHKMLLIVGPPRAGKGCIAEVLANLLGRFNVSGPTLASLATNFGLWPLIGKTLAIISDARLSGRLLGSQSIITERLLRISGEDSITIDRKNLPPVTLKLNTRIMLLTNELPLLSDSGGALPSRFIPLVLHESFLGKEDRHLIGKLLKELPGILLWAIEGRKELNKKGTLTIPQSSIDTMVELEHLSNPIKAFISEMCVIDANKSIEIARLFEGWRYWCKQNGHTYTGTVQSFGRNLKSVVPHLRITQPRTSENRPRIYTGIDFNNTFKNKQFGEF